MKALLLILLCMVVLTCRKDVTQPQFVEVIDTLYTDWESFVWIPRDSLGQSLVKHWQVYPNRVIIDFESHFGATLQCCDTVRNCQYKRIQLSHYAVAYEDAGTIFPRFYMVTTPNIVEPWYHYMMSDTIPYYGPGADVGDAPMIQSNQTKYFEYELSEPWFEEGILGLMIVQSSYGYPDKARGKLELTGLCLVGIKYKER